MIDNFNKVIEREEVEREAELENEDLHFPRDYQQMGVLCSSSEANLNFFTPGGQSLESLGTADLMTDRVDYSKRSIPQTRLLQDQGRQKRMYSKPLTNANNST
mmetsp:Transcript_14525/g.22541  ORF Transcript_14525/g.22541 Transcript_14525/m.22541 type:complete len:103 (+) Transcript_14525:3154-3462(+)